MIGCHTFKRRSAMKNGNLVFSCNGCEKQNVYLSAVAAVEDEEAGQFKLIRAPDTKDHVCWITGGPNTIQRKAKKDMCDAVLKDPTRSLQEIYESVRYCYTKDMTDNEKLLFFSDFPAFRDMKSELLRKRREVLPANPKLMRLSL